MRWVTDKLTSLAIHFVSMLLQENSREKREGGREHRASSYSDTKINVNVIGVKFLLGAIYIFASVASSHSRIYHHICTKRLSDEQKKNNKTKTKPTSTSDGEKIRNINRCGDEQQWLVSCIDLHSQCIGYSVFHAVWKRCVQEELDYAVLFCLTAKVSPRSWTSKRETVSLLGWSHLISHKLLSLYISSVVIVNQSAMK